MKIRFYQHHFQFPAFAPPVWSEQVDRWYQLDQASFALIDAYQHFQDQLQTPSLMILASQGASTRMDRQFVELLTQTQTASPAKFVYTLPSVRAAPLLQFTKWAGPVLCIQNDPTTWLQAMLEAMDLLSIEMPCVWICGIDFHEGPARAVWAQLEINASSQPAPAAGFKAKHFASLLLESRPLRHNAGLLAEADDREFWQWLRSQKSDEYELASWKLIRE